MSRPILAPTQPPFQLVPRAYSPQVRRPERQADHPPPSTAQVEKIWISANILPIRLHIVEIRNSDNLFILYLLQKYN